MEKNDNESNHISNTVNTDNQINGQVDGEVDEPPKENNEITVAPDSSFLQIYDSINDNIQNNVNPSILFLLIVILIVYFFIFNSLGNSQNITTMQPGNSGINVIEIIMWSTFIFLILINGLQYFLDIDVKTSINNIFKESPQVDVKINPEKQFIIDTQEMETIGPKEEVFHIAGNNYSYDEAKAVCRAFNSELATYPQVEEAYNEKGEWCSYGWSDNQMALFPTQLSTWKKLQGIKGHENDCGRPGINGGYIANPNVQFGVNCYGIKPQMSMEEKKIMETANPYPKTKKERNIDKMVKKYKNKLTSIDLSPFNYESWNHV